VHAVIAGILSGNLCEVDRSAVSYASPFTQVVCPLPSVTNLSPRSFGRTAGQIRNCNSRSQLISEWGSCPFLQITAGS